MCVSKNFLKSSDDTFVSEDLECEQVTVRE